jgi:hypothetical protein
VDADRPGEVSGHSKDCCGADQDLDRGLYHGMERFIFERLFPARKQK